MTAPRINPTEMGDLEGRIAACRNTMQAMWDGGFGDEAGFAWLHGRLTELEVRLWLLERGNG